MGSIHTIISDLTINSSGSVVITGTVNGGGAINTEGAAAGRLILGSSGSLTFTSAAACATDIVDYGGTLANSMTGTKFSGGILFAKACSRSAPAARSPAARSPTARWGAAH